MKVCEIFDLIQESSAAHLKHATMLTQIFTRDEDKQLKNDLFKCLRVAFYVNYKDKSLYMERVLSFMSLFANSLKPKDDDKVHPLLQELLELLLDFSECGNDSYRYWSCKLIGKILKDLEELPDDLYDDIKEFMIKRLLEDSRLAIKCEALGVLQYLQDPSDQEDEITSHMCSLVETAYHAKVRELCLKKIAVNKYTLPVLLNRIRDVDQHVRLSAFEKLHKLVKYLTISQRRLILQCGFGDSVEKIKTFISDVLLKSWLETYNNDYMKLISSIRIDASEEDLKATTIFASKMLGALFKNTPVTEIVSCIELNEHKLFNYENLNWDNILYYRIVIQYLQSPAFEETLTSVLPELSIFCKYIIGYTEFTKTEGIDELQYYFTLKQFFLITNTYDVSDVTNRQCIDSLVYHMLKKENLSTDVFEVILHNLDKIIPDPKERSLHVCEIISSIFYDDDDVDYAEYEKQETERSLAVSQLQSDISSLQEQERHCVYVEKNFIEAERIKNEISEKENLLKNLSTIQPKEENTTKKTDAATLLKCLTIAEAFLLSPKIKEYYAAIATFSTEHIYPALTNRNELISAKAFNCYAICCSLDHNSAKHGIHLFSHFVIKSDSAPNIEVVTVSLKASTELLIIYGLRLIEDNNQEEDKPESQSEEDKKILIGGTSLKDLIQSMAAHLNHEDQQVQETATKCICHLLLHSSVVSSSLVSHLIIKWANPATENEKLKQFIGLTLSTLTKHPNFIKYIGDAVTTTLKSIVYAPVHSPISEINMDNIIKFMVTLCEMSRQGPEIHVDLAFKICNQILDKPRRAKINFYFSKTLTLLIVKRNDRLKDICEELRDVLSDNQVLRNINKFIMNMTKNETQHNDKLPPVSEE